LSLGLDPHSLYGHTNGYINPEFCPDNATELLFLKRLNLLAASDSRTNILLSEFAAWAVSISLAPIPPELEAIANASPKADTPVTPEKVGADGTASEDIEPGNNPQAHIKGECWTNEQLHDLLDAHNSGKTQQELADAYGVKRQAISAKLKVARTKFSEQKQMPADLSMRAQATRNVTFGNPK
jgi:uncharacterized protein (DUF433 family)